MKLKIGHREGDYKIAPNNAGIFVYSYKGNKDFICIAKIFKKEEKGKEKIILEPRGLTPPEAKSGRTTNYIRINADLAQMLIDLLQNFIGGKEVKVASKQGKKERDIEELLDPKKGLI